MRLTEVRDERVDRHPGEREAEDHHASEQAVVDEHVQRDEEQADDAGDAMPGVELVLAERSARRSARWLLGVELHRQRAVAEHEREVPRLRLGEGPRDRGLAAERLERLVVALDDGADCTTPSSTIATCFWKFFWPSSSHLPLPSSVKSTFTAQLPSWNCAFAPLIASPVSSVGPRWYALGQRVVAFRRRPGRTDRRGRLVLGDWVRASGSSAAVGSWVVGRGRRPRPSCRRGGRVAVAGSYGGRTPRTGRKRSSAVRPMMRSALARSFTPGRSTTIESPWRLISGSATPRPSTRLRMMSSGLVERAALRRPRPG